MCVFCARLVLQHLNMGYCYLSHNIQCNVHIIVNIFGKLADLNFAQKMNGIEAFFFGKQMIGVHCVINVYINLWFFMCVKMF